MKVRPIKGADMPLIEEWIALDPEHSSQGMKPEFFFHPESESTCFEEDGAPVLFVRADRVLRLHIQFGSCESREDKRRIARTLVAGLPQVAAAARDAGYREILFTSVSPSLVRFCQQRLGFRPSPHDYSILL